MKELIIKGFTQNSLLDWEGKIVSTLYVPYCNFRCPYCHNSGLVLNPEQYDTVSWAEIENFLINHKGWVDGICLTGEEPCLFEDLPEFIRKIKNLGFMVKLDTNGSIPGMLREVIALELPDYIAMDIKASLDNIRYQESAGVKNEAIVDVIKQSIQIIMESGIDYEFRTTVVPSLHKESDIKNIASYIQGARKYALQNFSSNGELLSPNYNKIKPYNEEELNRIQKVVSSYVDMCVVRGV